MKNKILVIANEYTTILQFRRELITELVKRGFEVAVSVPKSEYDEDIKKLGCKLFYSTVKRKSTNPIKDLKYVSELSKTIEMFNPDICFTFTIKCNIYGNFACSIRKIPVISNITGLGESFAEKGFIANVSKFLYKTGLRFANWIFFQNSENMNFMIENKIVKKDKCSLLPGSGVNLQAHPFEEYPNNTNVVVTYIGRMIESKGTRELLECIETLSENNIEFRLIGKFESNFKQKIEALEKRKLLTYIPYNSKIHQYIKETDVVINPSYHEGMSNVLLEAAACGRPLLASNIAGCKEIINDGVNGFIFEPKSSDEIAKAIKKFVSLSHEERVKMGYESFIKVKKDFNREIIIENYIKKTNDILKLN